MIILIGAGVWATTAAESARMPSEGCDRKFDPPHPLITLAKKNSEQPVSRSRERHSHAVSASDESAVEARNKKYRAFKVA